MKFNQNSFHSWVPTDGWTLRKCRYFFGLTLIAINKALYRTCVVAAGAGDVTKTRVQWLCVGPFAHWSLHFLFAPGHTNPKFKWRIERCISFGNKRNEITEWQSKLWACNEGLHNLQSVIIKVIEWRGMWAGHVEHLGETGNAPKSLKRTCHVEDQGVSEKIIVKSIL
jgi:hypothetical protein